MATKELLMEPTLTGGQDHLHGLRLDWLRQAVGIYLNLAYPDGQVPDPVRNRLNWDENLPADELFSGPPFERAGKAPGRPAPIYALRLGNHRYPHMKLQIQPWSNSAGFMLSVNTHDQVGGVALGGPDAAKFQELQAENQRLKEKIEQAWERAGLPTFLRYLRDYIEGRRGDRSAHEPDPQPDAGPDPTTTPPGS
jgi:hypothetical protein